MRIIDIEASEKFGVGFCENCRETKPVRGIRTYGIFNEDRGTFKICFDCFGPRIFWIKSEGGKIWESPVESNVRVLKCKKLKCKKKT